MRLARTLLRPLAYFAGKHADRQLADFLAAARHTRKVQDELLAELIEHHTRTAFGRDHGLASVRSYEDFVRAVPIGNYETLRPYVDRVFHGQFEALLPADEQVVMFAKSSGTTGQPKHIPVTRRFLEEMRRGFSIFGFKALRDHPAGWLRPILQISSPMAESVSPTGLPCGAISGLLAATQKKIVRRMYVVPDGVSAIPDPEARFYTIFRCAVMRDVAIITTANPSSTIKLIETAQRHFERLVRDVADGTTRPPEKISTDLAMRLRFKPNPALARRLEARAKLDGQLLPRHFWNVVLLTNWTGGTLKLYLPRLRELFGKVPVRDVGLLASEGRFSVPLEDETAAGVAEITANFLEFIPAEFVDRTNPPTLRADQLRVGGEYFLVVTNWAGLWRYNMDDRIRVMGMLGRTPVFEFLSRGPHTANIAGEKITEYQVVEAMRLAAERLPCEVERFVLQGRFGSPPYYELRMEPPTGGDARKLVELMDVSLAALNVEYKSKRTSDRLGPIRLKLLSPGSMGRSEARIVRSRGGRCEQYKHQYLLTDVLEE